MSSADEIAGTKQGLPPIGWSSAGLALLTVALWGANPVALRYSLDVFPPIFVAGLRFSLAALFMLAWCRLEGVSIALRPGQWRPCLFAGLGLFIQIGTFNLGANLTSSSHTSMLINTFIFWVLLMEHAVTKVDRITARKAWGLVLASCGVVLILSTESVRGGRDPQLDPPSLIGDLILLCSAIVFAWNVVYVKQALKWVEPSKLIFWHDVVAVVLFFIWSATTESLTGARLTPVVTIAILYQGLFVGGICFAVQTLLLRRHSASQIAVFSFATPLVGVTLGVFLRGDQPTPWLFVSALCVAVGIVLVNLRIEPTKREKK
jgi:drug/metabolite transporter (DMT)-like permease